MEKDLCVLLRSLYFLIISIVFCRFFYLICKYGDVLYRGFLCLYECLNIDESIVLKLLVISVLRLIYREIFNIMYLNRWVYIWFLYMYFFLVDYFIYERDMIFYIIYD